jgi:hypothetical protein
MPHHRAANQEATMTMASQNKILAGTPRGSALVILISFHRMIFGKSLR